MSFLFLPVCVLQHVTCGAECTELFEALLLPALRFLPINVDGIAKVELLVSYARKRDPERTRKKQLGATVTAAQRGRAPLLDATYFHRLSLYALSETGSVK